MNAKELYSLIGRRALYRPSPDRIEFEVEIQEAKTAWGKVRVLVVPVSGKGQKWTDLDLLRLPGPALVASP